MRLARVLKITLDEAERMNPVACRVGRGHKARLKAFGLTEDEYTKLWFSQNAKCAICLKRCKSGKQLAIDHCHKTGKVRGLLCMKCNTAIGHLNDDVSLLSRAIEYLGR